MSWSPMSRSPFRVVTVIHPVAESITTNVASWNRTPENGANIFAQGSVSYVRIHRFVRQYPTEIVCTYGGKYRKRTCTSVQTKDEAIFIHRDSEMPCVFAGNGFNLQCISHRTCGFVPLYAGTNQRMRKIEALHPLRSRIAGKVWLPHSQILSGS